MLSYGRLGWMDGLGQERLELEFDLIHNSCNSKVFHTTLILKLFFHFRSEKIRC
jgi:hypothetical protein